MNNPLLKLKNSNRLLFDSRSISEDSPGRKSDINSPKLVVNDSDYEYDNNDSPRTPFSRNPGLSSTRYEPNTTDRLSLNVSNIRNTNNQAAEIVDTDPDSSLDATQFFTPGVMAASNKKRLSMQHQPSKNMVVLESDSDKENGNARKAIQKNQASFMSYRDKSAPAGSGDGSINDLTTTEKSYKSTSRIQAKSRSNDEDEDESEVFRPKTRKTPVIISDDESVVARPSTKKTSVLVTDEEDEDSAPVVKQSAVKNPELTDADDESVIFKPMGSKKTAIILSESEDEVKNDEQDDEHSIQSLEQTPRRQDSILF
jgi:hypothetical protein